MINEIWHEIIPYCGNGIMYNVITINKSIGEIGQKNVDKKITRKVLEICLRKDYRKAALRIYEKTERRGMRYMFKIAKQMDNKEIIKRLMQDGEIIIDKSMVRWMLKHDIKFVEYIVMNYEINIAGCHLICKTLVERNYKETKRDEYEKKDEYKECKRIIETIVKKYENRLNYQKILPTLVWFKMYDLMNDLYMKSKIDFSLRGCLILRVINQLCDIEALKIVLQDKKVDLNSEESTLLFNQIEFMKNNENKNYKPEFLSFILENCKSLNVSHNSDYPIRKLIYFKKYMYLYLLLKHPTMQVSSQTTSHLKRMLMYQDLDGKQIKILSKLINYQRYKDEEILKNILEICLQ